MDGRTIGGRYRVLEELGAGGSAKVYLARDLAEERDVALKVMRAEFGGTLAVRRFLREISFLSVLDHPGIVRLFDSGEVDGVPYLVTAFVDGPSLRQRLHDEICMPVTDAIRVIQELAVALDYAHSQHIIHRDIKPENVLFQGRQTVLADFGIGRAFDALTQDQLTDSQAAIGTPSYMSPEQGFGGAPLDTRSDVYSLGVVAYEMLAGCVPFNGPTPQVIQARKALDPVPSLRVLRPAASKHIEAVIVRALAVDPAGRFDSAGAFAAALNAVSAHPHT